MKGEKIMTDFEKREDALFEEWIKERNYSSFMKDGVIDEKTYFNEDTKILFVLKEANCPKGKDDLKPYLKNPELKGNWWRTWNNIARWTIALLENSPYPQYISREFRASVLKRVAFLNLKKVGGKAKAVPSEIEEAAQKDSGFIKKQIEMYDPDIIICCGQNGVSNAELLRENALKDNSSVKTETGNSIIYFEYKFGEKHIPVVSFCHPQMWGGHKRFEEKYNLMVGVRKELLDK